MCVCVCNSTPTTINSITVCVVYFTVCVAMSKKKTKEVCSHAVQVVIFFLIRSSTQQAVFQFQVCFQLKTYYMLTAIAACRHYFVVCRDAKATIFHRAFMSAHKVLCDWDFEVRTPLKPLKHTQNCSKNTNMRVKEFASKWINYKWNEFMHVNKTERTMNASDKSTKIK